VTRFSSRNASTSTVPAPLAQIWDLISDPVTLGSLTPLVRSIESSGDVWVWSLAGISALGLTIAPTFTERMDFVEMERIEFSHEPPNGSEEKAGAEGVYELRSVSRTHTHLQVDITLHVELPLPRLATRTVEGVMAATMRRTGARFAVNLYERLGLDPQTIAISSIDPAGTS
jgi:carbon monoxide dehydrogenase subunit G